MIHSSYTVGSIAGIRLRIHASTIVLALFPLLQPDTPVLASLASIGLVIATLLVHEFGHAIAARLRGLDVTEVVILPIGGYTQTRMEAGDWRSELAVVAGGPLVNLALAAGTFFFVRDAVLSGAAFDARVLSPSEGLFTTDGFLLRLFLVNAVLGVLNLFPAWPLDGGRILRAALVPVFGLVTATRVAARASQTLSVVVLGLSTRDPSFMLLASVFVFFCWRQASLEERRVRLLSSHRRALAARAPDPQPGAPRVLS